MKPARLRPEPLAPRSKRPWRQALGMRSRREGHGAEWLAALFLMTRGYQILGFRLKGHGGEVDILARRGRILAVVEVKRRPTIDQALTAVTPEQYDRLLSAGRKLLHGRPSLAGHQLRIDIVALAPGRFPRHLRGLERLRSGSDHF